MARSRNIKPGFFSSEELGLCDHGARLLFAALWTLADREGRIEDRPMRIRAYAFPYDAVTTDDVGRWLDQLESHGLIARYENGARVICVEKFKKHQNPHMKELPSILPDKPSAGLVLEPDNLDTTSRKVPDLNRTFPHSSCEETGLNPESLILNPESLIPAPSARATLPAKPKQPERDVPDLSDAFTELWNLYPKKGRTREVACRHFFVEILGHLSGDALTRTIRAIQAPIEPGGVWAESDKWAKGYVQNLETYLAQKQWREEPESPGEAKQPGMTEREARIKRQEEIDASWEVT